MLSGWTLSSAGRRAPCTLGTSCGACAAATARPTYPDPDPNPNPNLNLTLTLALTLTLTPAPPQRKRALKGAKDEQHLRILRESNPLGQAERACSQ